MKTAGIICEYNPFHLGHAMHIEATRRALGDDGAIVCVMSGNFVQRGEPAIFNKHTRAYAAVAGGADLVLELPVPYVLSSAEKFARAGVYILGMLGVCDCISFGSECGDIEALGDAAEAMNSDEADTLIGQRLREGLSYASAAQKAADAILGNRSALLKYPNNLLGIEYLKAIDSLGLRIDAMTFKRAGGEHDAGTGISALSVRDKMTRGEDFSEFTHPGAAEMFKREIGEGRGPVTLKDFEIAMLSRLRAQSDFSRLPGASEGLHHRISRCVSSEPSVAKILERVKTKRYPMARLRRMLLCACLGITFGDVLEPPPYIRVIAMNRVGMKLLNDARRLTGLPVIIKPSSSKKMNGFAAGMFRLESNATDFYVLAYRNTDSRKGGEEWRRTPVIID